MALVISVPRPRFGRSKASGWGAFKGKPRMDDPTELLQYSQHCARFAIKILLGSEEYRVVHIRTRIKDVQRKNSQPKAVI